MSSFNIRPRFKQEFVSSVDELKLLFHDRLNHENEDEIDSTFSGDHIILKVRPEDKHYWSPQLSLTLEPAEESEGSQIRGVYSPAPEVWTLFAFSYFALALAFTITGIVAYSFYTIDKESWLVWLLPVYVVIALVLYFVAQFGQKLGAEQTYILHRFYEETVGKRVHIS